jgi:hypothetical protein
MKRISVFWIALALVAGTLGCGTATQYALSVLSTSGGNVTHPGVGTFTYPAGAIVLLEAVPAGGYSFAGWSGNVSTVGNVTAATTAITMNGNYFITANFVQGQPIRTWYDLDAIRNNLGGNYVLMNNLDSTTAGYAALASNKANGGAGWQPIGNLTEYYEPTGFEGAFDGQEHQIKDLSINRPDELAVGLFAVVDNGGVIKNIGVVDANVTGFHAGLLVGVDAGTVVNCYSTGTISANLSGGLVGVVGGTVSNSYSAAGVAGDNWAGGLVGAICGYALACPEWLGVEGTVTNSYATGSVSADDEAGGLVGINAGVVSNSYSIGNLSGSDCVGGLVGANWGTVADSYSTASVAGNSSVGGLIGYNGDYAIVDRSYSVGSVSGSSNVGGLVGYNGGFNVTCSFWDIQTSGQLTSDGGIGQNTTQMQDMATFSGASWDITSVANLSVRNLAYIWNIVDDETYPFLSCEP